MAEGNLDLAGGLAGLEINPPKPEPSADVEYKETWVRAELAVREDGKPPSLVVVVRGLATYSGRSLVHGIELTEAEQPALSALKDALQKVAEAYEGAVKSLTPEGAYEAQAFAKRRGEVK